MITQVKQFKTSSGKIAETYEGALQLEFFDIKTEILRMAHDIYITSTSIEGQTIPTCRFTNRIIRRIKKLQTISKLYQLEQDRQLEDEIPF